MCVKIVSEKAITVGPNKVPAHHSNVPGLAAHLCQFMPSLTSRTADVMANQVFSNPGTEFTFGVDGMVFKSTLPLIEVPEGGDVVDYNGNFYKVSMADIGRSDGMLRIRSLQGKGNIEVKVTKLKHVAKYNSRIAQIWEELFREIKNNS